MLKQPDLQRIAKEALAEDIGSGDVTAAIFSNSERGRALMLAKAEGILSGSGVVRAVFRQLDPRATVRFFSADGEPFKTGDKLAEIKGSLPTLLSGERVALNFLQRLSGISTMTARFRTALGEDSPIGIYDTRKTTPLLRALEKAAVRHGGGNNHRFGLYDMAMLKNNHIDAAGGVAAAVARLRQSEPFRHKRRLPVCIEARNVEEALDAAEARADIVMLDNMTPRQIRSVTEKIREFCAQRGLRTPEIEISGGITLQNIRRYAGLPVDRISIGALTHSAPAIDIAMHYIHQPQE